MALDAEVLLLDDLGPPRDRLDGGHGHRHHHAPLQQPAALIATTNLPDPKSATRWGARFRTPPKAYAKVSLSERVGASARARGCFEMCTVVRMPTVEDYRLRKIGRLTEAAGGRLAHWSSFAARRRRAALRAKLIRASGRFPYYHHPRHSWSGSWLAEEIGIRTVAFSAGQCAANGSARDLAEFLRSFAGSACGLGSTVSAGLTAATLEPQLERHGGPIAFVEVRQRWTRPLLPRRSRLSGHRPRYVVAQPRSLRRQPRLAALAERGGHAGSGAPALVSCSFSGDERTRGHRAAPRRRPAALLGRDPSFAANRAQAHRQDAVRCSCYAGPRGVSAVAISNKSGAELTGPLRVFDPSAARELIIPKVICPGGSKLDGSP